MCRSFFIAIILYSFTSITYANIYREELFCYQERSLYKALKIMQTHHEQEKQPDYLLVYALKQAHELLKEISLESVYLLQNEKISNAEVTKIHAMVTCCDISSENFTINTLRNIQNTFKAIILSPSSSPYLEKQLQRLSHLMIDVILLEKNIHSFICAFQKAYYPYYRIRKMALFLLLGGALSYGAVLFFKAPNITPHTTTLLEREPLIPLPPPSNPRITPQQAHDQAFEVPSEKIPDQEPLPLEARPDITTVLQPCTSTQVIEQPHTTTLLEREPLLPLPQQTHDLPSEAPSEKVPDQEPLPLKTTPDTTTVLQPCASTLVIEQPLIPSPPPSNQGITPQQTHALLIEPLIESVIKPENNVTQDDVEKNRAPERVSETTVSHDHTSSTSVDETEDPDTEGSEVEESEAEDPETEDFDIEDFEAEESDTEESETEEPHEVNLYQEGDTNWTDLHYAAGKGDLATVKKILSTNPSLLNKQTGVHKWTALHIAAMCNHVAVATYLLDQGASTTLLNEENVSALGAAAGAKGSREMITLLISRGMSVESPGGTALHLAANSGNLDACKVFLEKGVDKDLHDDLLMVSPLVIAVDGNHSEVAKFLITQGADINQKNDEGFPLLHLAVEHDNVELIKLLLEKGLSVNSTGPDGMTALHKAVFLGNEEMIRFLTNQGALRH